MTPFRFSTACALLLFAAPTFAQTLRYTITPDLSDDGKKRLLEVAVEFYPVTDDTTWFQLPTHLYWSSDLERCYRNFRVEGKGGRYTRHPQYNYVVGVISRGAGPLVLHYEIWQNFPGEQVTLQTAGGPILQTDYVHVPGHCLLLTPLHYQSNNNYTVSIRWENLPKNWKIQNSFNAGKTQQEFLAVNLDWKNSNWVAGDFRLYQGEVLGRPVCFAIRGNWIFEDKTLFAVILKTIETQRRLWDDAEIPYYSVTMIPFVKPGRPVPGALSTGDCLGFGRFNSFAVYASDDCILDKLTYLFNHEMMHDWIGGKIDAGPLDSARGLRWFVEGFSEYFALRNCWTAGFFDRQAFFKQLNDDNFARHYASPHGEKSNLEIETCFYRDAECGRVPYRRGFILAFYFDCAIRHQSANNKTLHDFMLDLFGEFHGSRRTLQDRYDFFTETLGDYLGGEDPAVFLHRHAVEGRRIPPEAFRLPECLQMSVNAQGVPQFALKAGRPTAEAEFLR